MDIKSITKILEELAIKDNYQISKLQSLRGQYLDKKRLPNKIFSDNTIFEKEKYAFHHGGRKEMQFNIMEEQINGKRIFRYGLSISLKRSQSLQRPVESMTNYQKKFNMLITESPELFKDFSLWYYKKGMKQQVVEPMKIPDKWMIENNTIFLGKTLPKSLKQLSDKDFHDILKTFDELLFVYKFCVLDFKEENTQEYFARICWNDRDWIRPSGRQGKSKNPKSFERINGFGLEEWTLDLDKLIDGYKYTYLQAFDKAKSSKMGKKFNINFFATNSSDRRDYWICRIENLQPFSEEEAAKVYEAYGKNEWLDNMCKDVMDVGGECKILNDFPPALIFNVKFSPEDVRKFSGYIENNSAKFQIKGRHYNLMPMNTKLNWKQVIDDHNFAFTPTNKVKAAQTRKIIIPEHTIESKRLHDKIQNLLFKELRLLHGEENVSSENSTSTGTRIDICVNKSNSFTFYEVKSYSNLIMSIRAAFGQLLEYSHWPKFVKEVKKLIIVSHIPIDQEQFYLQLIRNKYNIPIYYQSIDLKTGDLSEEF